MLHKAAPLVVLTTLLRAKGNEPWQVLGPGPFRGHPSVALVHGSSWVQKHCLGEMLSISSLVGFHSPHAPMCTVCDSSEWRPDEERVLTHSSFQGAKRNSSALSAGSASSKSFWGGNESLAWKGGKLLTAIKAVAVLTQKKCCPLCEHVVLPLLGDPGCRPVEIWVLTRSVMQCHEILALYP